MTSNGVNTNELVPLRSNITDSSEPSTGGETTPSHLKFRGYNNNYLKSRTMDDSKRILTKIIVDFLLLFCVGFPILAYFLWGEPYKRGFFCDDESLKHPFHESTVRNWMLYIIGLVVPIILIGITETIRANIKEKAGTIGPLLRIGKYEIPKWLENSYRQIGIFGFGAACSQLTTDIAKYTIGRLRPHFFTVCQPIMEGGTNCSDPINLGRYIEEFECIGEGSSDRMLKEMRLSFPSGHSSFSAYTMVYCILYLQARFHWRGGPKLLRHFIQFGLLMMTWYTSLSRISDYKHHWSDVLAGAALGVFCAMIVASFLSDLFKPKTTKLPIARYETDTNGRTQ